MASLGRFVGFLVSAVAALVLVLGLIGGGLWYYEHSVWGSPVLSTDKVLAEVQPTIDAAVAKNKEGVDAQFKGINDQLSAALEKLPTKEDLAFLATSLDNKITNVVGNQVAPIASEVDALKADQATQTDAINKRLDAIEVSTASVDVKRAVTDEVAAQLATFDEGQTGIDARITILESGQQDTNDRLSAIESTLQTLAPPQPTSDTEPDLGATAVTPPMQTSSGTAGGGATQDGVYTPPAAEETLQPLEPQAGVQPADTCPCDQTFLSASAVPLPRPRPEYHEAVFVVPAPKPVVNVFYPQPPPPQVVQGCVKYEQFDDPMLTGSGPTTKRGVGDSKTLIFTYDKRNAECLIKGGATLFCQSEMSDCQKWFENVRGTMQGWAIKVRQGAKGRPILIFKLQPGLNILLPPEPFGDVAGCETRSKGRDSTGLRRI